MLPMSNTNDGRLDVVVRVEHIIVAIVVPIAQGLHHFEHRGHQRNVDEGYGEWVEEAYRVDEQVAEYQEALNVTMVGVLLGHGLADL